MRWLLQGRVSLCKCKERFDFFQQRCGLVNVKLKWVKDKELDAVVIRERHLKAVCNLVSVISSSPDLRLPIFKLLPHRGQLGLPQDLKLSAFIRRYPNIFVEHCYWDSAGTRVPCFGLTREAMDLYCEEADVLRVDLGLPYDYRDSLIPKHPDLFCLVNLSSDLVGLKLIHWDDSLAVSKLQLREDVADNDHMAFPVKFTRGFGLKRKSIQWLQEWQRLPYTSPYVDASHLDPRTDLSEKRNVGVFHELLHLTIGRKTERQNVSNLRKPFALPQKFTKVFERHPGIFYISMKCDTQTVILREAYDRRHLIEKHPLVQIREKFANMMNEGFLDTSRGLGQNSSKTVSPVWSDEEEEEKEEKRRTII